MKFCVLLLCIGISHAFSVEKIVPFTSYYYYMPPVQSVYEQNLQLRNFPFDNRNQVIAYQYNQPKIDFQPPASGLANPQTAFQTSPSIQNLFYGFGPKFLTDINQDNQQFGQQGYTIPSRPQQFPTKDSLPSNQPRNQIQVIDKKFEKPKTTVRPKLEFPTPTPTSTKSSSPSDYVPYRPSSEESEKSINTYKGFSDPLQSVKPKIVSSKPETSLNTIDSNTKKDVVKRGKFRSYGNYYIRFKPFPSDDESS